MKLREEMGLGFLIISQRMIKDQLSADWGRGYFRMRNFMQPYKGNKTHKSLGLSWKFLEHSRIVICH